MVHALAPDRSDQRFGKAILPRRSRCSRLVPDAQCLALQGNSHNNVTVALRQSVRSTPIGWTPPQSSLLQVAQCAAAADRAAPAADRAVSPAVSPRPARLSIRRCRSEQRKPRARRGRRCRRQRGLQLRNVHGVGRANAGGEIDDAPPIAGRADRDGVGDGASDGSRSPPIGLPWLSPAREGCGVMSSVLNAISATASSVGRRVQLVRRGPRGTLFRSVYSPNDARDCARRSMIRA